MRSRCFYTVDVIIDSLNRHRMCNIWYPDGDVTHCTALIESDFTLMEWRDPPFQQKANKSAIVSAESILGFIWTQKLRPDHEQQSSHSDAEGCTQAALSGPHLVSVPPEPLVRQTGQTRETLQQLVRKKHLPRSFILCTERQRADDRIRTSSRHQAGFSSSMTKICWFLLEPANLIVAVKFVCGRSCHSNVTVTRKQMTNMEESLKEQSVV